MELTEADEEVASLNYAKICAAYNRIGHIVTRTPVHTSHTVDALVGKSVYFKCENFQRTGSFKARGALNAVLTKVSSYANVSTYTGCVTHSSGNHGQALAWACQYENIPCTVVVPRDTPSIKIAAIEQTYGAQIALCDANPTARVQTCDAIACDQQRLVIKPYDDYDVMCGQGTVALEFLQQVTELDAIVVSVSGGGLISGIATYAKAIKPNIRILAVEPTGKELAKCIAAKNRNPDGKQPAFLPTKAEGIRTETCGELTFPILSELVRPDDVFTVSDDEMIAATKFCFERMKLVVELSAGAALAAVLSDRMKTQYPELKHIGVVLCGGNIDINNLPW